jgi:hypothetical protein
VLKTLTKSEKGELLIDCFRTFGYTCDIVEDGVCVQFVRVAKRP